MRLIRCTQNLLKKLKVSSPYTDSFQDAILGDWFANIFRIGRKQCVIFVNEKTLFSFIVYGIRLKPKTLSDAFIRYLKFVLVEEGIPQALVQQICLRYQDIEFAVTNSRSILGSMNDLVFLYRHTVMLNGGVESCDIDEIIGDINRTPQVNLEHFNSIKTLRHVLNLRDQ